MKSILCNLFIVLSIYLGLISSVKRRYFMNLLYLLPFLKKNRGDKNMIIIAGLGNPGKEYDKTKH